MRAVECPCGLTLSGADDAELFDKARAHADRDHEGITDDFIREHISSNATTSA
jgi:predicted small metal-binding protein